MTKEQREQVDVWDKHPIKLKCGLMAAPAGYYEGDRHHFQWDEAMDKTSKLGEWRLPTKDEWVKICAEVLGGEEGQVWYKNGADKLSKAFNTHPRGYIEYDKNQELDGEVLDIDTHHFWSSTVNSATDAHFLYFNSTAVSPANLGSKYNGRAVCCVAEYDVENDRATGDDAGAEQPEASHETRSYEQKLKEARNILGIQGSRGNWDMDSYMRGCFNGMELIMSIFEEREPRFKDRDVNAVEVDTKVEAELVRLSEQETYKRGYRDGWKDGRGV